MEMMGNTPSSRSILPWLSLVGIIWLQSINGTNSDFPAYSTQLKSRLRITQVQLNNLAVASDAGKLFGWFSGIAANYLPLWLVLLIGTIIGSIGYGVQFLFLANKITSLSYWQVLLLSVLAGNSISWINTVCYVASMRKFPVDHGTVVGLSTSYNGLSAKIYIAMAQVFLGKNPRDKSIYLLLNCVVPVTIGLIAAPFLGETKPAGYGNGASLIVVFVIAGATGTYAVVETMVPEAFRAMPSKAPSVILLWMVMLVMVAPLVKAGEWVKETRRSPVRVAEEVEINVLELEEEIKSTEVDIEEEVISGKVVIEVGSEHGVKELVRSVEFWLYFMVYACGATLGLVYVNNLGQISQSRGVSEALLVSISSSFGFFGKLASAPLSAFARSKYMVSRPASMVLLMIPMAGSFFLLLNPTNACLLISTAILGMCTGAITSIAVSMTSELFGSEHFGVNHNIVIANIPIGSFLFGYFAALIYDEEGGGRGTCMGIACYYKTFLIWGSICSFGTILSFVLYCRTQKCYSKRL